MRTLLTALLLTLAAGGCTANKPASRVWQPLFDGKTLDGWTQSNFGGQGETTVADGKILIPMADRLSGITYSGELPKSNYEVQLEARRLSGTDFFVGLTFPVNDSHASLILGGWGGAVCGISSLDGEDANHNETRKIVRFTKEQWYKVRLSVEPDRLRAWLDEEPIIDVDISEKQISIRPEISPSKPLGLSTFATTAEIRSIDLRRIPTRK